ncbi:helix-turn-helix transcriptional regulator [uncultured Ruegeria sp.]|uniref:helix-turn-helix domain-containing protein n=1 Tax=uncultured Ruegeria sp. TaxID=259304 RepID=UPI002606CEB0|nr:helix-turn-helix transcriptional regulator [uncultured Ruegeria sp.]
MSYQPKIDPKSRKAARFISQLQKKVQKALIDSGKTQQQVADILGVDRSVVNRRLKGHANLTARSIAEFAYAFGKDIEIDFVEKNAREAGSNISASDEVQVMRETTQNSLAASNGSPRMEFRIESATS